jgi:hypothetical protein
LKVTLVAAATSDSKADVIVKLYPDLEHVVEELIPTPTASQVRLLTISSVGISINTTVPAG